MKITSIYVDRLGKALAAHGVKMKRAQLLELSASAFGYHNSNEFTAAGKRGDLTPPAVEAIGTVSLPDGQNVIIVRDPQAGAPYGIDQSFIEQVVDNERTEKIGVTPYGHLAWLDGLLDQNIPPLSASPGDYDSLTDFAKAIHEISCIDADDPTLAFNALADIRALAQAPAAARLSETAPPTSSGELVSLDRRSLKWLIDAAKRYAEDLNSGLEDGIYEDKANLDNIETAIEVAKQRLAASVRALPEIRTTGDVHKVRIYTAMINHKHGTNSYAALSEVELYAALADYCDEYWSEVAGRQDAPQDTKGLSDREIVDTYFEIHDSEYLDLGGDELSLSKELITSLISSAPRNSADTNSDNMDEVIWLTDHEGNPTFDSSVDQSLFDRLGLSYSKQDSEFLPLTEREFEIVRARHSVGSRYSGGWAFHAGYSALYKKQKFHGLKIDIQWDPSANGMTREQATTTINNLKRNIEGPIAELGGHIIANLDATDSSHKVQILLPFEIADRATTLDDYFDALDYLINGSLCPPEYGTRVIATFRPQSWIKDYAVSVDPEGETKFDVTFDLLLMGSDEATKLDDYGHDDLRFAHTAPHWVQQWSGPFEVDIDSYDIDALFKIAR